MLLAKSTGNEVWICRTHPVLQAVAHINIKKKKKYTHKCIVMGISKFTVSTVFVCLVMQKLLAFFEMF